mgnify:CR=1 FL=1
MIGVVAALVVSRGGVAKHPVWTSVELYKVFCAVLAFLVWAAVGWFTVRQSAQRWWLAALCPAGVALLIGFAIPNLVVDSKQPQSLVDTIRDPLQSSRFVLANNVGVASGLAWELKRNDIILFGQSGELSYGLAYPDVKDRFVEKDNFAQWLATHRQQGGVSLVILLSKHDDIKRAHLPEPDSCIFRAVWPGCSIYRNDDLALVDTGKPADLRRAAVSEAGHPSGESGRRGAHIMLWLGLALLALGSGMLVWLVVLQRLPVALPTYAEPQFCLGDPGGESILA